jgi:hypothetical protein
LRECRPSKRKCRGRRAALLAIDHELLKQFKAAWERFAADEANVVDFLNAKRRRR